MISLQVTIISSLASQNVFLKSLTLPPPLSPVSPFKIQPSACDLTYGVLHLKVIQLSDRLWTPANLLRSSLIQSRPSFVGLEFLEELSLDVRDTDLLTTVVMQVVSYHTHIPHYIPRYTWAGFVEPMWKVIRFCTLMADLTLVPSNNMKVSKIRHSFKQQ